MVAHNGPDKFWMGSTCEKPMWWSLLVLSLLVCALVTRKVYLDALIANYHNNYYQMRKSYYTQTCSEYHFWWCNALWWYWCVHGMYFNKMVLVVYTTSIKKLVVIKDINYFTVYECSHCYFIGVVLFQLCILLWQFVHLCSGLGWILATLRHDRDYLVCIYTLYKHLCDTSKPWQVFQSFKVVSKA